MSLSRRSFLHTCGLAGAGMALAGPVTRMEGAAAKSTQSRPNVLFIAVDDLRPELGCYGAKAIKTPNMDHLARSGVTFARAYCQQAVCNPSRASLLTGLRPDSTKVWDLVEHFRTACPDVVTLPQHFMQNGYQSIGMGKIYHGTLPDAKSWSVPKRRPRGYKLYSQATRKRQVDRRKKYRAEGLADAFISGHRRGPASEAEDVADNARIDGALTDLALETLKTLGGQDKPFFLAVGYYLPHLPFTPPKTYWDMYDPAKIPMASNRSLPAGAPSWAMNTMYELRAYEDVSDAPRPGQGLLTDAQAKRLKHGYYASVTYVDAQIGRLLAALSKAGLDDNTVVVLWGDHGWKLGEHGSWCKQTNYEIDAHAPLIVRAPGRKQRGATCNALVEFVDIYPTLCELCGLTLPAHLEGTSMVSLLDNPRKPWKAAAFSQFRRRVKRAEYMGYSMRTDRYRFVEWRDRKTDKVTARELYDHADDPGENRNLADDERHFALVTRLGKQLRAGWKGAKGAAER